MLEHKNFMDIKAFKTGMADAFQVGDKIHISEKLDGSNASFQYNTETGELDCFSRNNTLTASDTLFGFYGYVKALDVKSFSHSPGYRFFGEWNLRHLVRYQEDQIKQFHCFDVWDVDMKEWMPQDFVRAICSRLELNYAPELYCGPFISWEHVASFVGQTKFGLKNGEGVVVKNQDKLNSKNERMPSVIKLVSAEYQESMGKEIREPINPDELAKRAYLNELTESIVTEARVEKLLYKGVADGMFPENWGPTTMGLIAKELPRLMYHDCIKEEPEVVAKVDDFGKRAGAHTMGIVKKMLLTR